MALEYAKKYSEHVTHVVMIARSDHSKASHDASQKYFEEQARKQRAQGGA